MPHPPISHYEILEKLGEGGMGVVWKARDTRLNRLVAIKTLSAKRIVGEDHKRRFIQEAQAASALNHPNIVTIHDIASEDGTDFIVMEYVEGKTLGQLIPKRGLRLDEILRYAIQIGGALAKAHAAGIIHRDLKPGNVMVTADGRVKLLDFGLAKLVEPAEALGEDERTRTLAPVSEAGTIIGTAAYMSPEQAESKPVDARSDIFSFGAVLYEMATGEGAFQGDSKLSTLSAILRENPKPPSQVASGVPRELDRIIARCLRKDPARRFQDVPDLLVALEELKEESDFGMIQMTASELRPAKTRSRLVAGVAAAVTALAAAGGWYVLRTRTAPVAPPRSVPLTSYPGSQLHPSFSPDGSQIAFAWNGEKRDNWDIYVKLVDGGSTPLRLTTNPAADQAPAWSPDGRQIAFIRLTDGVYSVSPLGGPERKLADGAAIGIAWTPDSQSLLISTAKSTDDLHSIFQLSLATGEMRRITTPPGQANPTDGDYSPAVSPDGRALAFIRYAASAGDIYVQPIAGGPATRVTRSSQRFAGLAWVNNRELIFSSGAEAPSLWRIAADGRTEPERVTGALDRAIEPACTHPASGPARLAYSRSTSDYDIWRMGAAPDAGARGWSVTEPAPLIVSTYLDMTPQFSPDGKRIAFTSDRDGAMEIWTASSDGSNPSALTAFKGPNTGAPRWSPDGRQIVFDSLASGNNDIWIVGSEGGAPRRVTTEPSNEGRPSFSRDGRWIYFRSDRSGSQQIWKVPAAPPFQPAAQVTRNGGFEAAESGDGRLLYVIKPGKGLWSMPVDGGEEAQIIASVDNGSWQVTDAGIYYIDSSAPRLADGSVPLVLFSLPGRKVMPIARLPRVPGSGAQRLAVARDGRQIAWTQTRAGAVNLVMIENFR
jgi:Tol biopolymer transport system component/tRNA A-37 threonylcarbamoyl transferase component Bud32